MNKRLAFQLLRYLVALILIGAAVFRSVSGAGAGEFGAVASGLIVGTGLALGAAALLAPELIALGTIPLRLVFNSILFPNERGIAPPDYTLPQVYRDQGRYDEAMEQYLKIIANHPQELLAYIGGVEAAYLAEQPAMAAKIAKKAWRLKTAGGREQVERALRNPPVVVEVEEEEESLQPPWYRQDR